MSSHDSIEQFRLLVFPELIEKGIKPPQPGSPREQELYSQWKQGLNRLKNGGHSGVKR